MARYVHLEDCAILSKRERAMEIEYDGARHWIPYSQLPADDQDGERFTEGDRKITVSITEWIAGEKGIEVE